MTLINELLAPYVPYLFAILLSLILLKLAYELLKTKWPEYYFSFSEENSLFISLRPYRFISFRALPIFVITLPILGTLARDYSFGYIVITSAVISLLHALMTNGRAVYLLAKNSSDIKTYFNKPTQIIYHLCTIFLCCFCGILSGYLAQTDFVKNASPTLMGMRDNLWSSALIVLIGVYGLKSYKNEVDIDRVFRKTLEEIKPNLKIYLQEKCKGYNANYNLALAVCLTESIQRPVWLRGIEKIKSIFYKAGTYGIMQVKADHRLSDEESIDLAVANKLRDSASATDEEIEKIILQYNSSENFQSMVKQAYDFLCPRTYDESTNDK